MMSIQSRLTSRMSISFKLTSGVVMQKLINYVQFGRHCLNLMVRVRSGAVASGCQLHLFLREMDVQADTKKQGHDVAMPLRDYQMGIREFSCTPPYSRGRAAHRK